MKLIQKAKEKNIFRKLKKGDERAFIQFYDQYVSRLYRFIYLKINSRQDSEDLTSDAFLRLWKVVSGGAKEKGGIEDFRGQPSFFLKKKERDCPLPREKGGQPSLSALKKEGSPPFSSSDLEIKNPRAMIYQIARNLVVDYYRKKPRAELIIDDEKEKVFKNIPSQDSNLEQKAVLSSDFTQIKEALSGIKPIYQELIIWHYLDDFSIKEISQILEKPQNNVRVQLHRALKALRGKMEE